MINEQDTPEIDDFVDLLEIGRGGFSHVYSATQVSLHRRVAIKVIDTTGPAGRRFERETLALGAMSQIPHVVTTYQVATTTDGRPALVMALMPTSIGAEIRSYGPVRPEIAVRWAGQLAGALDRAHALRIFHRDIKPENVLVSAEGDAFLADFGIAALDDLVAATTTSMSISPPFAPPERFTGDADEPLAGDVYSLAATIYAALAGRSPYGTTADGGSLGLMLRVATGDLPPIDTEPPMVNSVLASALATDPRRRHRSASEFAADLAAAYEVHRARVAGPAPVADPDATIRRAVDPVPTSAPQPDPDATVLRDPPSLGPITPACILHRRGGCRLCHEAGEQVMSDGDRVVYDIADWPLRWVAECDAALNQNEIDRAWHEREPTPSWPGDQHGHLTLTVWSDDEWRVDDIIDAVLQTVRMLRPHEPRTTHEVGTRSAAFQAAIERALDSAGIPFQLDDDANIVTHATDHDQVSALIDAGPDDSAFGYDGYGIIAALSMIHHATGILTTRPTRAKAVLELIEGATRVEQFALPVGFEPSAWREIVVGSLTLRDVLEGESEAMTDNELSARCAELHRRLENYV